MKTPLQICQEIKLLPDDQLETSGIALLEEYHVNKGNQIGITNIFNRMIKYLQPEVISHFAKAEEVKTWNIGQWDNNCCCVGVVVERTILDMHYRQKDTEWVVEYEYAWFADMVNKVFHTNLLNSTFICQPFSFPLAVISPSRRMVMAFYAGIKENKEISHLKKFSNIFNSEGELPHLINEIEFY